MGDRSNGRWSGMCGYFSFPAIPRRRHSGRRARHPGPGFAHILITAREDAMSRLVDRRPAVAPPVVLVLRVLGAALLAAMAWIHLYLWGQGYSDIHLIGPAFMLNAVAGFVLAAAVLVA